MAPQFLGRSGVKPTDSTHSIARSGFPLGVKCNFCLHCSLIDPEELKARHSRPRLMSSLQFTCKRCRRGDVQLHLFWCQSSVTKFMRTDD